MKKYIFITTEGFTFQPYSDSVEPDIENMQVIGFAQGDTAKDAMKDLIKKNTYLVETSFDEVFAIQIENDYREYFSLRNNPAN